MDTSDQGTGKARGVTPKRQGAKVSGGAKRPADKTQRVQLHLGATTVKRLAVHCGLVGRSQSALADQILTSWLARYGQGKELFPSLGDSDDEVESAA